MQTEIRCSSSSALSFRNHFCLFPLQNIWMSYIYYIYIIYYTYIYTYMKYEWTFIVHTIFCHMVGVKIFLLLNSIFLLFSLSHSFRSHSKLLYYLFSLLDNVKHFSSWNESNCYFFFVLDKLKHWHNIFSVEIQMRQILNDGWVIYETSTKENGKIY